MLYEIFNLALVYDWGIHKTMVGVHLLELISKAANFASSTSTSWKLMNMNVIMIITIIFLAIRFAANSFRLKSYWLPVFTFRQETAAKCPYYCYCTVCLDGISDGQKFRRLPECKHCFHVECIDAWFQSRSTCPLCRIEVAIVIARQRRNHQDGLGFLSFFSFHSAETC